MIMLYKMISWNIDSLNAALTSDSARAKMSQEVLQTLIGMDADIIALQETKLKETGPTKQHIQHLEEMFPEYEMVWRSSGGEARKGYAGTMFLYKKHLSKPEVTYPKIDAPSTMDDEGRIITLEFDDFYLTQVYTPNAGDGLNRLQERMTWDDKYKDYLVKLNQSKPVIACGDYNVAVEEIDLANPEGNRMSAGFTDEERQGFRNLLNAGFVDTFRIKHGNVEGVYSWFAQRVKTSKINNSGWRIDYFLTSESLKDKILKSDMIDSGPRQDHVPLYLEIEV